MRDIMKIFKKNKQLSKELGKSILALEAELNKEGSFWERHKDNPEKLKTLKEWNDKERIVNDQGFIELKTFLDLGVISQMGLKAANGENVVDMSSFMGLLRLSKIRQERIIEHVKKVARE